jgi:hypothetical protein
MEGGSRIHGTTWDVYLCLLTSKKPIGARDVWRKLHLSSPSLAQYHINKLIELDMIQPVLGGKYLVKGGPQGEVLKGFFRLRGRLVPRFVVYGAFLAGLLLAYLSLWPFRGDFRDLFTISVCLVGIVAFFFEAYLQYKYLRRDRT